MITEESTAAAESGSAEGAGRGDMSLRLSPRFARPLVLAAVFVCAASGLVYELALVALGSYLVGNSITQASIVLSVMVFAMGIGSLAAKPLQSHAVVAFAAVEAALALVGGLSVLGLYAAFAWLDLYTQALIAVAFVIGMLIGAEIPLLMTLLQRIRRQEAGSAVADLFAADYVGALVGGLAFPFLLLPVFGQIKGALVVGALNAVAGIAVVLWLFRDRRHRVRAVLWAVMLAVLLVLGGTYTLADDFEVDARQALFRDPIAFSTRTPYQEIVITRAVALSGRPDLRLFLNGDLQFSSVDEYRYHESLVHPVLAGTRGRVLILGGGDGLALREVLRYPDVREVTLVELDPEMIHLAKTRSELTELNRRSFFDSRVTVTNADAFTWLRSRGTTGTHIGTGAGTGAGAGDGSHRGFDAVIVDMPDPDDVPTAKLYSLEFYGLVRQALAPGGRMVVQAGSPFFAPKSFWCIERTMREAGLATAPYHVDVPSFGDWGFVLAEPARTTSASSAAAPLAGTNPAGTTSAGATSAGATQAGATQAEGASPGPVLRMPDGAPPLRYLDADVLAAARVFGRDLRHRDVETSTLIRPRILDYENQEWQDL